MLACFGNNNSHGKPHPRTSNRSSQGVFSHRCLRKASAAHPVSTGLGGSAGIAGGLAPSEVEGIQGQMGEKVKVTHPGQPVHWGVTVNIDKKPFDDERVRKALSLALNRYEMAETLAPLTGLDTVGGPQPPGSLGALTPEELQQLPGFGKDSEAGLKEAKRLLAEAG